MTTSDAFDEFFPESSPPTEHLAEGAESLIETDHIAILRRVIPKAECQEYASTLAGKLLEVHNSLEAYVRVRNLIEILELACAQLKDHAILDVNDSICEVFGARVQLKQLPRKFEYNDRILFQLEAKKGEFDAQLKARRKFLETLPGPMKDESGEQVYPAKFISGGVTLQVSF